MPKETTMKAEQRIYKDLSEWNTLSTLASGNPRRIKRRLKNVLLGRALRRIGFWRLWR